MLDELKRYIVLSYGLVRGRITTYYRKLQIRRAYDPAQVIVPMLVLSFLIISVLTTSVVAMIQIGRYFNPHTGTSTTATSVSKMGTDEKSIPVEEIPEEYCFAPFPAVTGQEEMKYMIVADKYDRVLHLLKNQKGKWGVIKSYPIAIGAKEGRKEVAGDKKTPEGVYFIVGRKEKQELNAIYGPLAYVLNYPNGKDSIEGRTGQGIWIHGTEPGQVPVDTKGCLELHNNNIEKLATFLRQGSYIPVVIHNNSKFNLEKDINLADVWEQRQKVVKAKTTIAASSNVAEGDSASSVVDSVPVEVVKVDSAKLKHLEVVVAKVDVKPEAKATSKPDTEIKTQIEKWRSSWEKENMQQYQACYDTVNFASDGYNWARWREKKTRTFKNYEKITVGVSGIQIAVENDSTATAFFRQKYQSDQFHANNGKKLALKKRGGNWKIVQEITATYKE